MSQGGSNEAQPERHTAVKEAYSHGYGETASREMARRTAAVVAGFVLPYLRSGMTLPRAGLPTHGAG
jgi:hypothetical protein